MGGWYGVSFGRFFESIQQPGIFYVHYYFLLPHLCSRFDRNLHPNHSLWASKACIAFHWQGLICPLHLGVDDVFIWRDHSGRFVFLDHFGFASLLVSLFLTLFPLRTFKGSCSVWFGTEPKHTWGSSLYVLCNRISQVYFSFVKWCGYG